MNMIISMWRNHKASEADKIDYGYDIRSCKYSGALYKGTEAIGIFIADSYREIWKKFPQFKKGE